MPVGRPRGPSAPFQDNGSVAVELDRALLRCGPKQRRVAPLLHDWPQQSLADWSSVSLPPDWR